MTNRVLLTVSGTMPSDLDRDVAEGRRPEPDYVAMARAMSADLLDVERALAAAPWIGKLLHRLGGVGLLLAWVCFRRRQRYDTIVTDGEQVGLPLAMLLRAPFGPAVRHAMVVHVLSPPKKARIFGLLRLGRRIDLMIVYSSWQGAFITAHLGYPAEQVLLTPFMVDTEFFSGERVTSQPGRMICAAGLERRDYQTLMAAVEELDVRVVIAAASPWSRRADETRGADLPANVETCSLGFVDLRQLYADADLVVMPLVDVDFQAGITTILEAMAMGKAVVCTRTRGQTDAVDEGVNGVYVPPGDAASLRAAITDLLDHPDRAAELGRGGRTFVEARCDVRTYADRLATAVAALNAPSGAR